MYAYSGKVIGVRSFNSLDAALILDPELRITAERRLHDRSWPDTMPANAMHALVVLLGSKRIFVEMDRDATSSVAMSATIYLHENVRNGTPGLRPVLDAATRPLLHVGEFLAWLAEYRFDVARVRAALNGARL